MILESAACHTLSWKEGEGRALEKLHHGGARAVAHAVEHLGGLLPRVLLRQQAVQLLFENGKAVGAKHWRR